MSTTLTEQISQAQRQAAAAAEARVRQWAQTVVDDHRAQQRDLLAQWREARDAVEGAIATDPHAVPQRWSRWADVSGEIAAEHADYVTALSILDPANTDPAPAAPVADLPDYGDLVALVMRRLAEERVAEAADRRQAALTAAMQVEGLS